MIFGPLLQQGALDSAASSDLLDVVVRLVRSSGHGQKSNPGTKDRRPRVRVGGR